MNEEQQAAYIISQSAVLLAVVAGMEAENLNRHYRGEAPAYAEAEFQAVIDNSPVHHNAVIGFFH